MSRLVPCRFLLALLGLAVTSHAKAQQQVDDIPWKQRSWEQQFVQSSYEDEFTFKRGEIFTKDPFVWAVSQEFAERFGMPREWIDPGLKGALAVAWRTTTIGLTNCGYGGNPNACWPAFTCQMDVYVDSATPIPWRFDDVERDVLWQGLSSLDYVPRRPPAPRRSRYTFDDGRLGSKGVPFHNGPIKSKEKGFSGGHSASWVIYFDRAYAPGVTLLGFRDVCPPKVKDAAILRFFTDEEQQRTRGSIKTFVHTIELSEEFVGKITDIYERDNEARKELNSAYQQIMKRHFPK